MITRAKRSSRTLQSNGGHPLRRRLNETKRNLVSKRMPPTLCLADITVSLLKAAFGELTDGKSCHEKRMWGKKEGMTAVMTTTMMMTERRDVEGRKEENMTTTVMMMTTTEGRHTEERKEGMEDVEERRRKQ